MSRCLVSFGVGEGAAWREFALPPMQAYAKRHGYETCFDAMPELSPPSWGKVPLLLRLLESHDAVLWLDADVMVMDWSEDIADYCGLIGLVAHRVEPMHAQGMAPEPDGLCRVPNCGVWFLSREAAPLLTFMLRKYERFRNHPWWEQAALIESLEGDDVWRTRHTTWLDPGWNRHPFDRQPCDRVRFYHATAIPNRIDFLRTMARYFQ
jgi:hypothetical protein